MVKLNIFTLIFTSLLSSSVLSQSNLKIHSELRTDSPLSCGLEFIDVGVQKDGEFDIYMTLLRDTFGESYGNTPAKIREVYSYELPYKRKMKSKVSPLSKKYIKRRAEIPTHPPVIISSRQKRSEVVTGMITDLALSVSEVMFISAIPAARLGKFLKNSFKQKKFIRSKVSYFLGLAKSNPENDLYKFTSENEINSLLGLAGTYSAKGLLATEKYYELVESYHNAEARANRISNYNKLVNVLNREGLVAKPLNEDFILVLFDPKKDYARAIDIEHTDLNEDLVRQAQASEGDELVPLGVYSLSAENERLLTVDFSKEKKLKNRKTLQKLSKFGKDVGGFFVPTIIRPVISVVKGIGKVVFNAEGRHILTSTITSEAHLAALIDSGVASIDKELVNKIRKNLSNNFSKIGLNTYGLNGLKKNRDRNKVKMNEYLRTQAHSICYEVKKIREKEFRKTYLTYKERLKRFFTPFWIKNRDVDGLNSYEKKRLNIINERGSLIDARAIMNNFDETRSNFSEDLVVESILRLAKEKDSQDIPVLNKVLKYSISEKIEMAAIFAAKSYRDERFFNSLEEKMEHFSLYESIFSSDEIFSESLRTMSYLDIKSKSKAERAHNFIEKVISYEKNKNNLEELQLMKLQLQEKMR